MPLIPLSWDVCDDSDDDDDHVRTRNTLDHFSDIFSSYSLSKVNSQRIQNHLNLILSSFLVRNDNQGSNQGLRIKDQGLRIKDQGLRIKDQGSRI